MNFSLFSVLLAVSLTIYCAMAVLSAFVVALWLRDGGKGFRASWAYAVTVAVVTSSVWPLTLAVVFAITVDEARLKPNDDGAA